MLMTEKGLADMDASADLFSGHGNSGVGAASGVVLEGNRPLIVQVQALTNRTIFPYPKRVAEGVSTSRLQLICAILDKFAGTDLGSFDVYLRTAGGFKLVDVQSDLAIAAAIISSYTNVPIKEGLVFAGEVGLNGRVMISRLATSKLKNLTKMGANRLVGPLKTLSGSRINISSVDHLNSLKKALE
jgi:DNA repair protein RadA/Sms